MRRARAADVARRQSGDPVSGTHFSLYLLSGSNLLPSDMFGDASCSQIDVGLFGFDASSGLVQVECYRTGFGDLRLLIPIARRMAVRTIVLPIARLAREGLIAGPFLQTGASIEKALLQTGHETRATARDHRWAGSERSAFLRDRGRRSADHRDSAPDRAGSDRERRLDIAAAAPGHGVLTATRLQPPEFRLPSVSIAILSKKGPRA